VNLGGVASDHVEIHIEGQAIQLSGERLEHGKAGMRCYHIMEIERGHFLRVVPLPAMVDAQSAHAVYHHGLLVLTLKKKNSGPLHGCWQADSMEGLE
jgi:HSP20 family protein